MRRTGWESLKTIFNFDSERFRCLNSVYKNESEQVKTATEVAPNLVAINIGDEPKSAKTV